MPKHVVIDLESGSEAELTRLGPWPYACHKSTRVWCCGYAIDDQSAKIWRASEPVPPDLLAAITDPECLIVAWNSSFERALWEHVLPRYGWPALPPVERWRDAMSLALAVAMPARLDKFAKAVPLAAQKVNDGIMHQSSKPRAARGAEDPNGGPYWLDDPEHLQQLYAYCLGDVECERAAFLWLPPLTPVEQELWCLHERINERGFAIDRLLVEKALAIIAAAEQAGQKELQQITGGEIESSAQRDKLLAWLKARGCELADLQKDTVTPALRRTDLAPEVRRVLQLRQAGAHASANKFAALRAWCCDDGRIRGCFRYHGAGTGRWSAGGPQPQNLARQGDGLAAKLAAAVTGDINSVQVLGAPLEIVGDVARAAICAGPKHKLLTADYSAIESRTLAWITGETSKLALWARFDATGDREHDPYIMIGDKLGFRGADVRVRGKRADLAFGFGGGIGAFRNFAPEGDTSTDEQIRAWRNAWRRQHPRTTQFWYDIERAAVAAVISHTPQTYGRFTLRFEEWRGVPFLFIELPSKRRLAYPYAKLITNDYGSTAVSFMDNAIVTGGWSEYRPGRGMWGGGFTENLTQAVARDLLAAAILRLEATNNSVVLHVHDNVVCEVSDVVAIRSVQENTRAAAGMGTRS